MKAARVKDGELTIFEDPTPEPAPDYARVRITSAGVLSLIHISEPTRPY